MPRRCQSRQRRWRRRNDGTPLGCAIAPPAIPWVLSVMSELSTGSRLVLQMMHLAFVEIRSTDNLKKARGIADILHNVPNMIANGRSAEKIVSEIKSKANRHEAWPLLEMWFQVASNKRDFRDEWTRLKDVLVANAERTP